MHGFYCLQVPGETSGEAAPAGKKTIETVKAVRPEDFHPWGTFDFVSLLFWLVMLCFCAGGENHGGSGTVQGREQEAGRPQVRLRGRR